MSRSVPLWSSDNHDAAIPRLVKARIFKRQDGICALSGRKIGAGDEWHCDHITPLADGGRHAEDNLQAVLAAPHREKTAVEAQERAKARRIHAKHFGFWPQSKARLQGRPFQKSRPEPSDDRR